MKKLFLLLPVLGVLSYVVFSSNRTGPGIMSGVQATGAGSSGAGCGGSGCHGTSSSASLTVTVGLVNSSSTPVTTYTPGGTYSVVIGATNTSAATLSRFGFQVAATKFASSVNAGTFAAAPTTHLATIGGINLVEHSNTLTPTVGTGGSGTVYAISIPWTAPAAGTGTIQLFGVLNAVNNDGSATASDMWNHADPVSITEASATIGTIMAPGGTNICPNTTTPLTCTPAGGTWSSSTPTVGTVSTTGVVTGVAAGTTTISYTVTGVGTATKVVTVMAAPGPIGGTLSACVGASTTLTCSPASGAWSSGATAVATVNPTTGTVTGVSDGTATISYAGSTGCSSTAVVTINAHGAATITGTNNVCVGTTITLHNLTPSGTWASSTPTKATVNATTGVVTGVAIGTTTISYTATNTCGTGTTTKTVNVLAAGSCSTTGVAPIPNSQLAGLSIYPNPNNGTFMLALNTGTIEEAHVTVCNISGEKVKEFTINTNTPTQMQMPHISGMYFVSVATSQGNYIGRLVIQ